MFPKFNSTQPSILTTLIPCPEGRVENAKNIAMWTNSKARQHKSDHTEQ